MQATYLESRLAFFPMSPRELKLAYEYACRMRWSCFTERDRALWDRQIAKIEALIRQAEEGRQ